jgi:hypothetical protein
MTEQVRRPVRGRRAGAVWGAVVGAAGAALITGVLYALAAAATDLAAGATDLPTWVRGGTGFVFVCLLGGATSGWIVFPQVARSPARAIVLYYMTAAVCVSTFAGVALAVGSLIEAPFLRPLDFVGAAMVAVVWTVELSIIALTLGSIAIIPTAICWYVIVRRPRAGL